MAICKDCGESYDSRRARLGYRTCTDCGSPREEFLAIPVAKSNYIVGTKADLQNNNHKGPRTW
jgi:anaerobic ribonucleoside-triphosphate reductase